MTIEQLTKNLLIILHLEMEYDYFGNLKLNRKDSGNEILAAVDKLEEALAQTEQEPWCMTMNGCKTKCEDCPDTITAIEEALAQPEQKPLNEVCNEFYQALAKGESSKQFTAQNWFQAGFAISEAAHGIGEKK